jgi:hypothetical protein
MELFGDQEMRSKANSRNIARDNLNTHRPKQDRWLKAHPQVPFHFIPDTQLLAQSGGMLV